MSFSLEKVPVSEYLPDTLNTLAGCPEEVHKSARAVFRKMHFWKMRADAPAKRLTGYEQNFAAEFRWENGTLDIALRGRLDTMTAPELLSLSRKETAGKKWNRIRMDMKELEYISSAGQRVLMILQKEKPKEGELSLCRLKPAVREIFETTGFDQLFLLEGEAPL